MSCVMSNVKIYVAVTFNKKITWDLTNGGMNTYKIKFFHHDMITRKQNEAFINMYPF